MSASDFLEDALLNHILNAAAFGSPASVFLALSTTPTTDAGAITEPPVGNGYARIVASAFTLAGGGAGSAINAAEILFPQSTGSWGTITHFAIFDALTGGNMLLHGAVNTPVDASVASPRFKAGDLTVTVS